MVTYIKSLKQEPRLPTGGALELRQVEVGHLGSFWLAGDGCRTALGVRSPALL